MLLCNMFVYCSLLCRPTVRQGRQPVKRKVTKGPVTLLSRKGTERVSGNVDKFTFYFLHVVLELPTVYTGGQHGTMPFHSIEIKPKSLCRVVKFRANVYQSLRSRDKS